MAAAEQAMARSRATWPMRDAPYLPPARLSAISDTQADRVAAGALRTRIAELRAALVEAEGNCDRLARESAMRSERLGQIAQDHSGWANRLADADGQIQRTRCAPWARSLPPLPSSPPSPPRSRPSRRRWAKRSQGEVKRQQAADRLAIGETRLGEADKALRGAEGELAGARESRVRREGLVEQATKDREGHRRAHRRAAALRARRCAGGGRSGKLDELPEMEKASIAGAAGA